MGNYLLHDKIEAVKATVNEKVEAVKLFQMQQGDSMRSAQMAMQIAVARDQLQWGLGFYGALLSAAAGISFKEKAFPKILGAPIVILGFVLAYNYDFAYGTKLVRVRKEAEHILDSERHLLLPAKQMPLRKLWIKDENLAESSIKRVGDLWPKW